MKTIILLGVTLNFLGGTVLASVSVTDIERAYLALSSRWEPLSEVTDEHLISFMHDVDGNGRMEVFITREGLRDGKQAYSWTIYSPESNKVGNPVGEATFSQSAFSPQSWEKHSNVRGFYTYGPGGGGEGILNFFAFDKGRVVNLEERRIVPIGADKLEFEKLFYPLITGEKPGITEKRTSVLKATESVPSNLESRAPSVNDKDPTASNGSPAVKSKFLENLGTPAPKTDQSLKAPISRLWLILAMVIFLGLVLLWIKRKKS